MPNNGGWFWPAALGSALLLILAMPGLAGWWPLAFVALVPLLAFCRSHRPGRAFAAGLVAGFLHHLVLLYWIVIVLGRYGNLPLPLSIAALCALALYMGLYLGIFTGLASWMSDGGRRLSFVTVRIAWVAPFLYVALEYLRSTVFTGFPWMDLGYALAARPLLIQAADLGGIALIGFCVVLANCVVLDLSLLVGRRRFGPRHRALPRLLAGGAFLAAILAYSAYRLEAVRVLADTAPKLAVTVVQGNVDQALKWTVEMREETIARYLRLSEQGPTGGLLIWPETALPFYPQRDELTRRVMDLAGHRQAWLLTGAPWFENGGESGRGGTRYYNAALLLGPDGRFADVYHKTHLVPFGEYVPLRKQLFFLKPLVEAIGDFTPGRSSRPLQAGAARLGVLICYESIFPEISRRQAAEGANLLVNVTNDAWYGRSSAPHHSMAMVIIRAVETRRSLARAANTGISGFVLPSGEVAASSGLFTEAALSRDLPLLTTSTVHERWGHWFALFCLLVCVVNMVMAGLYVRNGRRLP